MSTRTQQTIAQRVAALPWQRLQEELDAHGFAQTPVLLNAGECRQLVALFEHGRFRKTVTMGRHGYGRGEYRYLDRPLPPTVEELRGAFYPPLAQVANRWAERLREELRYPPTLEAFLARCRKAGQSKPTPLLLRYGAGDWNALHQDIYGEVAFPFQIVTLLERPDVDFTGGEFVLVEQRLRAQSRPHVCALRRGACLIFATRQRPAAGTRGYYRAAIRHGVSTVRSGRRTTLGVIFHDAT